MALIIPDTVKIVEDLVNLIGPSVTIDSITDNGDGTYKIDVCNSYWIKEKSRVTISGTVYKVIDVVQNDYFTVKKIKSSDQDPTGTEFTLDPPFYIHGSIMSVKTELDSIKKPSIKYPMVFLYEVYRERLIVDKTNPVGFETRVRLFFMNDTDPRNYTNATQYENVIRPMRMLVQEFLNVLDSNGKIINKLDDNADLTPYVNFGKFETDRGEVKKLFNDDISGYELSINLPIKREYLDKLLCENKCNC
jgi:hypothetical protein